MASPVPYARWIGWQANAHRLGRRWRSYAGLLAATVACVAMLALLPGIPLRQQAIGLVVGGVTMTIALSIADFDDPVMRGELAERWTEEVFRKRSWPVVSNLIFDDGDLDHLVVAPSGVLAVETKYRYRQSDRRRLAAQRHWDLKAAQRAARKGASLLRSRDFGHEAAVAAVLVVWGPGSPELADGYRLVDDVYVLDGHQPSLWSHLFSAPLLGRSDRECIVSALHAFQQRQAAVATDRWAGSLRRACWNEFWAGVREVRGERSAQTKRRRALQRRHADAA